MVRGRGLVAGALGPTSQLRSLWLDHSPAAPAPPSVKSPHLARTMVNGSHLEANSAALPHKAWRPPPRSTLAVWPGYSRPADDTRALPAAADRELARRGCADARDSHPGYCSLCGVRAEAPAPFLARVGRGRACPPRARSQRTLGKCILDKGMHRCLNCVGKPRMCSMARFPPLSSPEALALLIFSSGAPCASDAHLSLRGRAHTGGYRAPAATHLSPTDFQ